jgi:hypothetical protein
MSDSFLMVIAAAVFFAASLLCAFLSKRKRSRIAASLTWPSVKGAVLSNALKTIRNGRWGKGAETYSVNLLYRYAIGGTTYDNSRISWGIKSADLTPDIPEAFVREYPAGHAIDVFYDPAQPAMAMIDPAGSRFRLMHVNMARVMAWTFAFCGTLALIFSALS